jgi:hypothetical protein
MNEKINDMNLEEQIKKLALDDGASLVGICSAESIKDKEFSDANYLLRLFSSLP